MISLFVQRAAVLMLRPAALMAEALFAPGGNIMIFAIPIAALALTASSIPVHTQYMMATRRDVNFGFLERSYVSGLMYVTVLSVAILSITLVVLWKDVSNYVVLVVIFVFIIEKFSDESTRFYEFKKEYNKWFISQSIRSGWLFVPIVMSNIGYDYAYSFLLSSILLCIVSIANLFIQTGLRPSFSASGFTAIRNNSAFLSGPILLSIHRQGPRILVALAFPVFAHFFQVIAQIGQVVSLLFNVRFVVPYRAIISRHPRLFEQRMRPVYRKILLLTAGLLVVTMLLVPFAEMATGDLFIMGALVVAMTADALAFSLMSAHWGFLPWLASPRQAFATSGFALMSLALFSGAGYVLLFVVDGSILLVPCLTTLGSAGWIWLIRKRHFGYGSNVAGH